MEKTRLVYQLDTPFSSVQWWVNSFTIQHSPLYRVSQYDLTAQNRPKVSEKYQDEMLGLLCRYVLPVVPRPVATGKHVRHFGG